jgi:hypothetical protein
MGDRHRRSAERDKPIMLIPAPRSAPDDEPFQVVPAGPHAGQNPRPQTTAALGLLTGLWVAISPRFLPLQRGGTNVAADMIIGLVVAGIGTLTLVGRAGFHGLRLTGLVLGIWVVLISSFILDAGSPTRPRCTGPTHRPAR